MQIDSNVVKNSYIWCTDYLESLIVIDESFEEQLTTACVANYVRSIGRADVYPLILLPGDRGVHY
jgi:hypothetical protein